MPKTYTDFLRERLEPQTVDHRTAAEVARDHWSKEFEDRMRHRLVTGHFRYGIRVDQGVRYDTIQAMQSRLQMYVATGNQEYLADLANFCMLEYMDPVHENAHFEAGDDNNERAREL